ncbi:hypothetical protein HOY34_01900 [Xinfangfangia sp. D13-10-4-6]|uniref:hypothetical protein n=1 Tax=Pseudogemmobacter hezensis TaxID=2737662 RepID=UPI001552CDA7|nr:hypothetical protein [Pseudogemmobacter hezensis]NPD13951.1 hypothetical protein [Pseudogemmobacter hezensis]
MVLRQFPPHIAAFALALGLGLTLGLGTPAAAQMHYDSFVPGNEQTDVNGAYKRYQTHVLKLSAHRYAVLFQPGFVDQATAARTVTPLCAATGRVAAVQGQIAPVDVLLENGEPLVQQGFRVACVKSGG